MLLLVLVHLLAIQDDDQLHLALWFRPDISSMVVWPYTTVVLIITTITNLMVSAGGGTIFFWAHTNDIR